jgi:hypothetical protein
MRAPAVLRVMMFGLAPALLAFVWPSPASAGLVPDGSKFRVDSVESWNTRAPRVAIDAKGRFRIVWMAWFREPNMWDIQSRAFTRTGEPLTNDVRVHAVRHNDQANPSIAVNDAGDYLVAWEGWELTHARMFDSGGAAAASEISLDDPDVTRWARWVAADGDGFLVASVDHERISGLRLDRDGERRGQFEHAVERPERVAVAPLPDGSMVAVWSTVDRIEKQEDVGLLEGNLGRVHGGFLDGNGVFSGAFRANEGDEGPGAYGFLVDGGHSLSVSADALGNFHLGFDSAVPHVFIGSYVIPGRNAGARYERFPAGKSEGSSYVAPEPSDAVLTHGATSPGGNTVLIHDGESVSMRAFDCHGNDLAGGAVELGTARQAGKGEIWPDRQPGVAVNEAGDVVATWAEPAGDHEEIVARIFRLEGGCALCGDADANGRIRASDALHALRTAVGSSTCVRQRCDTDDSTQVTALDALRILIRAVSGSVELDCADL